MPARDPSSSRPARRSFRHAGGATVLAASLLALSLGGCQDRNDLLSSDLVVFQIGQWVGAGAQGEELRFLLERDDDEAVLTAFIVQLPGLRGRLEGRPEACAALAGAFTRFGNREVRVPIRNASFGFRTPKDFRVDRDGLIRTRVVGRFDAPNSATVDADIEIDATRFLPCRGEFKVRWQMAPLADG